MDAFGDNPDLEELEYQFSCGLCFEPFVEPRTLKCSHSLCGDCTIAVYKKNPVCPFCRSPFGAPLPPVNERLENMTKAYLALLNKKPVAVETPYIDQKALFLNLPADLTSEIFGYLSWRETVRSFRVCKQLQSNLTDQFLWKGYCFQEFPFCDTDSLATRSWKDIFRVHTQMKIGWTSGRPKDFKMTPWRGHEDYVNCFSVYRKNVASGSNDNTVRLWRYGESEAKKIYSGHTGLINYIKFSEILLASASEDWTARLWDTQSATLLHTLKHEGGVDSLFFTNQEVYTASKDRNVRIWDVRSGTAVQTFQGYSAPFKIEPLNGSLLVSVTLDEIRVWDTKAGNGHICLHTIPVSNATHAELIGNNILVTGHNDGSVRSWNCSLGTATSNTMIHNAPIRCMAVGKNTVITGSGNDLNKFDLNTKASVVMKGHSAPVNDVKFDENKVVSCGQDGGIKVWNISTGTRLYSLLGGSLQARGRNPSHPLKPGFSGCDFDQSHIVGSVNNMLRVYSFCVDIDTD